MQPLPLLPSEAECGRLNGVLPQNSCAEVPAPGILAWDSMWTLGLHSGDRVNVGLAVRVGSTSVCLANLQERRLGPGRWPRWSERPPVNQKVVGSVPCQGKYGRQPMDVSLSPSPISKHILR